jgi:organic radical activating enzyme
MMGQNEIRKQDIDPSGTLNVHSMWHTLQGEGPFSGVPAVFIRLWGCNLKCFWCDTDFESKRQSLTPEEITEHVKILRKAKTHLVVITGGEPFRQNIIPLVNALWEEGFTVQIETAGTLTLRHFPWSKAHIVVSPKTGKINKEIAEHACAWKYIIKMGDVDFEDGLPNMSTQIEDYPIRIARPPSHWPNDQVYLSPCDEQDECRNMGNMRLATRFCLTFGYRLSLQTHKIVGVD